MISTIWNNWLLVALIPPILYAVVALVDACLVDRGIYVGPREATIMSALFGALPLLLLIPYDVPISFPPLSVAIVAFVSGIVFAFHIYFYIAGLFIRNDTVLAETIQNLSVLLVPLLAFFVIGEIVTAVHYLAIGIAGIGVVVMYVFNRSPKQASSAGARQFFVSMLLFCFILIAGQWVYDRTDFWSGYVLFTAGLLFTGIVMFIFGEKKNLVVVVRKYWRWFVLIEGITTVGMICSHRAVDISPSVTYVAITECMGAYFILLLSGLIYWVNKMSGFTLGILVRVCTQQLIGYPGKIIAGLLISSGIYMVNAY